MKINSTTKIAALIKEDPKVIDVIASINKHFKKLQNPILRKVLANRITIADAAKVGGVPVTVFYEKLAALGFEIEAEEAVQNKQDIKMESTDNKEIKHLVSLDVRPILEGGTDPFKAIMGAIKSLKIEETLEIINSFEPIPLIHKLKEKGYESWTKRSEEGVVFTYFKKLTAGNDPIDLDPISASKTADFNAKLESFGNDLTKIDVRMLEMPEPMTTILEALENITTTSALFVDHKKVPQFLLPELVTRGYEIMYKEISEHHLQLLIYKQA
ncbi:MAG: hypothetical protein COB81_02465 [Flavobacteriaceae bacterium]|nr:MAG: hypothetical protein COB81_02465 [Flavobacteriaceae bacterium]